MKILIFNLIIILFLTFNVNYIQEKKIIINEEIIPDILDTYEKMNITTN